MTPEWFTSVAVYLTVWFWAKAFFMALVTLFFVFSLVVARQVFLMSSYVETDFSDALKTIAVIFSAFVGLSVLLVWRLV